MEWSRSHTIGHGSSATVSLAISHQSGEVFAVKSAEVSRSDSLQREQKILSSLNSPYIVGYKGCDISRENNKVMYNLLLEYVPNGTLGEAVQLQGGRFDESRISFYIRGILEGIEYLHSNCLVHCDIKGSNILIGENGPKIADFGCARWVVDSKEVAASVGGTPMYMAPEVVRGEEQGYACDIWAIGCTTIEMATGSSPWPSLDDPISVLYRIGYSSALPEIPSFLSKKALDFIEKCLKRNPQERWTANQLLKHPFLGEFNSSEAEVTNTSSPTSILDIGFWSCVEKSESFDLDKTIQRGVGDSPCDRIRRLAVFSGEANWTRDENWVTARRNEVEVEAEGEGDLLSNSDPDTPSTSYGEEELVIISNLSSEINEVFFRDYDSFEKSSVICNVKIEGKSDKMLLPSISNFL